VEGLPGVAHGLFPRGGVELIFYFYTDCNKQLAEQLAEQVKQQSEDSPAESSSRYNLNKDTIYGTWF